MIYPKVTKIAFEIKESVLIADSNKIREDSDYDYKFIADAEQTQRQIETAEELIGLAEEYICNKM